MPTIISDARSFRADRAWGARDIAEIEGASVRLHWTDQPYQWHVNDGAEVFLVLDGVVEMRYRVAGEERSAVLNSDDLSKISEIKFNLNGAETAIVNVSGSAIALNQNFLGGTKGLGENVIWNFADATSVAISTAWGGSVLAPKAIGQVSNSIDGSGVFGSLQQNGRLSGGYDGNYVPPTTNPGGGSSGGGNPTPVPEETIGLFALGAAGLGLLHWRRRRKAKAARETAA